MEWRVEYGRVKVSKGGVEGLEVRRDGEMSGGR